MPRLSDVLAALDALWPPERAEQWDAVGTVCGDPDAPVTRVLFAVDPVREIADEAVELGAELIVTHHPLYLRGTTTVAASTFKGRVVHTLIKHDIALHVAHTNADTADPGVSDALAGALDLRIVRPLVPDPTDPHGRRGLGRVCELDRPATLRDLAARVAHRLPATAQGVRIAGDPDALVRTVAVSGGSGDSLFDQVRAAGVDAFLTADLRHHPVSEATQHSPLGLIDAAHWATEWPWCEQAAAQLDEISDRHGWDLRVHVSKTVTDPWTSHFAPTSTHPVTHPAPNPATHSSQSTHPTSASRAAVDTPGAPN
ncbi:Nif3-like dinuclear metal center hexameric protein [Streptomyces sp. NRRL F-5135]|uniref:Nif3-like dinuclear metal center hexameric protein n=1 Tax=Streptomyces sp. NRRL F-5135 TaxID=1463858 RepID=UPI0004CA1BBE|nr:Nif3-like dinuclear metal center hexameric protein [Streptomyces sp. NRRL F-5135]